MFAGRAMFTFRHLRPQVTVSHDDGALKVRIKRHHDRILYIIFSLALTVIFVSICDVFLTPFFSQPWQSSLLWAIPVLMFWCLWYYIGLRITLWRAFGVEEIAIDGKAMRWTRTALWWKRRVDIPVGDVTQIKAVTPWHTLRNRIEFSAQGKKHSLGEWLFEDEIMKLLQALQKALRLPR